jgi:hypothetical protein
MIIKINSEDIDVVEVLESPRYKRADGEWHDIDPIMHRQLYETFHGVKLGANNYARFMSGGLNG